MVCGDRLRFIKCDLGVYKSRALMLQLHPTGKEDFEQFFWKAVCKIRYEKPCEDGGIVNGVRYTLPSNQKNFGICGACYVKIMKPLDWSRFWVPKRDLAPGVPWLCCLSRRQPRIGFCISRFLEMFYKRDAAALDEFVSLYAFIPRCSKEGSECNRPCTGGLVVGYVRNAISISRDKAR